MLLPATLTDRVAFQLQLVTGRAQRMGQDMLDGLGLAGREYGVLALLELGPVDAQRDVGATLGLDRTTTTKLVRRLEERGLIRRTRAAGDGRARELELTADGERLRAAAAELMIACDETFLGAVSAADRRTLTRILRRLAPSPDDAGARP